LIAGALVCNVTKETGFLRISHHPEMIGVRISHQPILNSVSTSTPPFCPRNNDFLPNPASPTNNRRRRATILNLSNLSRRKPAKYPRVHPRPDVHMDRQLHLESRPFYSESRHCNTKATWKNGARRRQWSCFG